ncbi:MAG: hypothetical protein BWY15_01595 [Firmicutes bacterium ADurb.Bin193]|nr:MAG: hypothetical protein BWY15_01595 [Firmicutes bacterium ADurb.Bin193]
MSLCIFIQHKNDIYMAGDSRMSVDIDGTNYRWNDNYNKIEQVGNLVIFKSGSAQIMTKIIEQFKTNEKKDVNTFQKLCIEIYNEHKSKNGNNFKHYEYGDDIKIGVLIGTIENDIPALYFISESLGFEKRKMELPLDKEINEGFLGVKCDEAIQTYKSCVFDFNDLNNVFENYKKIYESVTGTNIGGNMTLFHITKNKIESMSCGLKNPEPISELSDYLLEKYFKGNGLYEFSSRLRARDFLDSNGNSLMTSDKLKLDGTKAIDKITVNQLLIGGENGTISFDDLSDKPNIPVLPNYIQSTKITSTTIESPTVRGGNIIGGKLFAVDNPNAIISNGDVPNYKRLIIDSNGLSSYNANNQVDGIQLSANDGYGKLEFIYHGQPRGQIYQDSGSLYIRPEQRLRIGNQNPASGNVGDVQAVGKWDFSYASEIVWGNNAPVAKFA